MNIILLGYMASGKSIIGRKLATVLNKSYRDLDTFIEDQEGMSISEIFSKHGEIYFRKRESYYLNILLDSDNLIISLGGGTPCYGLNMATIKNNKNSKSIYLNVSVAELSKRLFKNKAKRPLVSHLKSLEETTEFVGKHIFERASYYKQADLEINANASLEITLERIIKVLG